MSSKYIHSSTDTPLKANNINRQSMCHHNGSEMSSIRRQCVLEECPFNMHIFPCKQCVTVIEYF